MWHKFLARLSEPSSWAAIAAGLGAIGLNIPSPLWQGVTYVGCGVAIILGIVIPEGD